VAREAVDFLIFTVSKVTTKDSLFEDEDFPLAMNEEDVNA